MQLPIKPAPKLSGQLLILTASLNCDRGVERSGVKGPFMCGSSVERLRVMCSSYSASASARSRFCGPGEAAILAAALAIGPRCVDSK